MKIYSWKTLLAAFAGVAFIVYQIFHFNGFASLIYIFLVLYYTVQAFQIAFNEFAFRQEQERAVEVRKIWCSLFGPMGRWIQYIPFFFLIAAIILALAHPTWVWPVLILWLCFIVSALVLSILFRRRKAHPEKWHDQPTPSQKEK